MVGFISTMIGQKRYENIKFTLEWYKEKVIFPPYAHVYYYIIQINPILEETQQKIDLEVIPISPQVQKRNLSSYFDLLVFLLTVRYSFIENLYQEDEAVLPEQLDWSPIS